MENNGKKSPLERFWILAIIVISSILAWLFFVFKKQETKSNAASSFGVSRKVLRKWIKIFCSEKVKEKYKGKKKYILMGDLYFDLGIPFMAPKYRNEKIIKKEDLRKAFGLSHTSLTELIKKAHNPEKTIGMSLKTYLKDLEIFPPNKIVLICNYIEKSGYKKKSW